MCWRACGGDAQHMLGFVKYAAIWELRPIAQDFFWGGMQKRYYFWR